MEQKLDQIIMDYYRSCLPSKQRRKSIKKFESFIKESIMMLLCFQEYNPYPEYHTAYHVFGSIPCKIASVLSDLDIAILIPEFCQTIVNSTKHHKQRRHAITKVLLHLETILTAQYMRIYNSLYALKIEKVFNTRVPILRVTEPHSNICSDISVANVYTKPTLKYMKKATTWHDHRIKPIMIFIKTWAKEKGVNNSHHGYLNSFGFTLLIMKYLQIIEPPILPIYYFSSSDFSELVIKKPVLKENKMSLNELIAGFFHFYSHRFDPSTCTVSVLGHRYMFKDHKQFECNKAQLYLIVEDPIQISNNVARNVRKTQWDHTVNVFKRGYRILSDSQLSSDLSSEFGLLNKNDNQEMDQNEESEDSENSDYDVIDANKETLNRKLYLCGGCYIENEDGCIDETDGIWYCLHCWKEYNIKHGIGLIDHKENKEEESLKSSVFAMFYERLENKASECDIMKMTANCLGYLGDYKSAKHYFTRAMEHSDRNTHLFEYGCFLFEWKRFEEAKQHFVTLLDYIVIEAPQNGVLISTVYLYYARTLEGMNETHQADMYYRLSLSDCCIAVYYYALFLSRIGRYTDYECYLKQTIEIYPQFTEAIEALKMCNEKKAPSTHARIAFDKLWQNTANLAANSNFNVYYDNLVRLKMNDIGSILFVDIEDLERKLKCEVKIRLENDLNYVMNAVKQLKKEYKEFSEHKQLKKEYWCLFRHYAIYTFPSLICNIKCEEDIRNMIQEYNKYDNHKNDNAIQIDDELVKSLLSFSLCMS